MQRLISPLTSAMSFPLISIQNPYAVTFNQSSNFDSLAFWSRLARLLEVAALFFCNLPYTNCHSRMDYGTRFQAYSEMGPEDN